MVFFDRMAAIPSSVLGIGLFCPDLLLYQSADDFQPDTASGEFQWLYCPSKASLPDRPLHAESFKTAS